MTFTADVLALLLLIASAAALGLSFVIDAGRVSREKTRESRMSRQFERQGKQLGNGRQEVHAMQSEIAEHQARLTEFIGRRQRLLVDIRVLTQSRIELIHEINDGDFPPLVARLRPLTAIATLPRRELIFSRQIWDYQNSAHIYADSPEKANVLLRLAFNERHAIETTRPVPLAQGNPGEIDTRGLTGASA